MNIRSLSTGGLPARDLRAVRMGAISSHASSVSNKRTDIRFPLEGIVMNGIEKTYHGIMNSSTRPSQKEKIYYPLREKRSIFFNLSSPILFVDSSSYHGVQIADIVASALIFAIKNAKNSTSK